MQALVVCLVKGSFRPSLPDSLPLSCYAMTRHLLAAALLLFSVPAFAEGYTVDKDAWICKGQSEEIRTVEALAQRGDSESRERIRQHFSDCLEAGMLRGPSTATQIVNLPVTVMYASGPLAYVCNQTMPCGYEAPGFDCHYALISDIRDSHGNRVALEQMQKEARGKTMTNIVDICPECRSCPN
jgi:hypothetical protein